MPGDLIASVLVLQRLQGLSDREAAEALHYSGALACPRARLRFVMG